jgi:cytochrome b561
MVDTATIIEWILIILVFGMYFTMPLVVKRIDYQDKRLKVFQTLKISYFIVTVAMISYIAWEFVVFDMERNFRLSRVMLILIAIIMYYFNIYVKSKRWFE